MKYACLIYENEKIWQTMSKEESEKIFGEYYSLRESLRKNGKHLGGNSLEFTNTATTVRVRDGKLSTTDGPFAETKEQFLGFFLVEAKDLNEAIAIAAKVPGARHGCVEVRPIREIKE